MSYDYRYMHIERLGKPEVEGILDGYCEVFPKLDGSNGVILFDNGIKVYSRNNEIKNREHNNNFAGLFDIAHSDNFVRFFKYFPSIVLYGEWLVPHSIKYLPEYYNRFWIFDAYEKTTEKFISYNIYKNLLSDYGIEDVIHPLAGLAGLHSDSIDVLQKIANEHRTFQEISAPYCEGIVVKNYSFKNQYGTHWAKVLNEDFLNKKGIKLEKPKFEKSVAERNFVNSNLSISEIEKEKQKIIIEKGYWKNNYIPELQDNVYQAFIQDFDCNGFDSRLLRTEINRIVAINSKE